jgi:chaperonin GroES
MALTPLGKRVVVKPSQPEEVTSFGLIMTDAGKEKPMQGEIVSVSAEVSSVKSGDMVVFKKYSPTEFSEKEGEVLYILDEEDVLAKLS